MAEKTTYGFDKAKARNKSMEKDLEMLLVRRFNYLGMEAQAHARSYAGYTDRTGNLKNSIGYHTTKDKVEQTKMSVGQYNPVPVKEGGSLDEAKRQCDARIESYDNYVCKDGIGLVVVAGMKYAPFVEAKGFNVLDLTFRYIKKRAAEDITDIEKLIMKKYGTKATRIKNNN